MDTTTVTIGVVAAVLIATVIAARYAFAVAVKKQRMQQSRLALDVIRSRAPDNVRIKALDELALLGDVDFTSVGLVEAQHDRSSAVRQAAIAAVLKASRELMKEADELDDLTSRAPASLYYHWAVAMKARAYRSRVKQLTPALVETSGNPDAAVRQLAATALERIVPGERVPVSENTPPSQKAPRR